MSDLHWLTEEQMARLRPYFPKSRGRPRVDDYNTERPHSSLGYATPAAFAVELEQQRPGSTPPVASPALMRDNTGRSLVAAG